MRFTIILALVSAAFVASAPVSRLPTFWLNNVDDFCRLTTGSQT